MNNSRQSSIFLVFLLLAVHGQGQLREDFYSSTCPEVELIVLQVVATKLIQNPVTPPATLQLFFHDCFVSGCDASVMITSPNFDAEKDAPDNLSLAGAGFDTIIEAKQAVETQCPGIVSCADILAIAARDVVFLTGGPDWSWNVELGRRDGLISKSSLVSHKLPHPDFNLTQLNKLFAKNNLTQTDMIALSGAHTIGFSHCSRFANRIYSFSPSNPVDPTLDPNYAQQLMRHCPRIVDPNVVTAMDPETPRAFDNLYFKNLVAGKGLFTSDAVLFNDPASKSTVLEFAQNEKAFNRAFAAAMRKLGRVGVKIGDQGVISRDCLDPGS